SCVEQCEKSGCIQELCFPNCKIPSEEKAINVPWYFQEPLFLRWKKWDCRCDCRYHCMLSREEEREKNGDQPLKYHGKWPFKRVFSIQEPFSVALSTLNLALHFHGWLSFFILLHYKLPLKPNGDTYYQFVGLCYIYAILAMNSWFWSAIFHGRYVDLTERLHYSSNVVLIGYSLILSILKSFNIRTEAPRVMVSAPIIAFLMTHVLYLNLVELNYVLNMFVEVILLSAQLVFWSLWAARSHQQSKWKLWIMVVAGALHAFLQIYDFAPYEGLVDAHAICQAISVILTYLFWSVIRDDAKLTSMAQIKKAQ
ncbi:hypothetical protein V2J09_004739, partial [Rumex salicifolius]